MLFLAAAAAALCSSSSYLRAPRLWMGDDSGEIGWQLTEAQQHYCRRVMRLKDGDVVRVFGALIGEFAASIDKTSLVPIVQTRDACPPSAFVDVYFAPLKKKRSSLLVEKAVELGATSLRPVVTEFTEKNAVAALGKLDRTAIDAAQQCERLEVPLIAPPTRISEISGVQEEDDCPFYVCLERQPDRPHLLDLLLRPPSSSLSRDNLSSHCSILVGPEGGLSEKDLSQLAESVPHATYVSLGPSVLRAETAVIAALSLISAAAIRV